MSATLLRRGLIVTFALAAFGLAAGCSGDSDTPPVGPVVNSSFEEVQPQINTFLDSAFVAFSAGFSSYNEVPITDNDINLFYGPGQGNEAPVSTYEYTASGWHHITYNATGVVSVVAVNDSLQFSLTSVVQENPSGADLLDYRHHWSVIAVDQTGDFNSWLGDAEISFFTLTGSSAQLVGSYDFTSIDNTVVTNVTTNNTFVFTSTFSNIIVSKPAIGNWGAGCPASGTINFTINQSKTVSGVSGTVATVWTGTAVFVNGVATITLSDTVENFNYVRTVCLQTS